MSREGELIELGAAHNLIEKSGAWYSYKGERIGQGKENVRQFLKDTPAVAADIERQLRAKLLANAAAGGGSDESEEVEEDGA